MNMLMLSIITINYNNVLGIKRTYESLKPLFANYPLDIEWVIIDGGSTDGSAELVLSEEIQRIPGAKISEKDSGIYNAMNKGVAHANGEYFLFLNSGDTFAKDLVEFSLLDELDGTQLVYGNSFEQKGNREVVLNKQVNPGQLSLDYFLTGYLCHPSIFFHKSLFEKDKYDESYRIAADYDFIVRKICVDRCTLKHIDIPVAVYESGGISDIHYYDIALPERKRSLSAMLPGGEEWYDALLMQKNLDYAIWSKVEIVSMKPVRFQRLVAKIVGILVKSHEWIR